MPAAWNDIEILIVGAGTMGASLAQTYAQSGFNVGMLDVAEEILQGGLTTIERELEQARGKIFSASEVTAIRQRILPTTNYEQACRGKNLQLVIEAATERVDIKKEIFKCLDLLSAPHVVIASNSSSLNTNLLAQATRRPDRVVWMHYFYLPHKNRAGEYAGTDTASEQSKSIARNYLKLGGKIPTYIRSSRKGGVADIIFVALLLEATQLYEEGYDIPIIEAAARKAYGIPLGFLELMDVTGLPVGLYSMRSFSDASNPNDPLHTVYGNFYTPTQRYAKLVEQYNAATDKSAIRWITDRTFRSRREPPLESVDALAERFLAIGFLTATECVDAGLIIIEDLEQLAQNAFLWQKGPFTLMNEIGTSRVESAVKRRAEIAASLKQDFPVCHLLKKRMGNGSAWSFHLSPVSIERELGGAVRRITLSNPRAANAMDATVFEDLKRQFSEANDDDRCKVIMFDTAPIKTFIAGAHIPSFIERITSRNVDAILRDTREWQHILFHIMTGTSKPKIAIVDGQAFGGGVEVACAFALDPNSIVLITNRTSFSLPETRLGIYPGLRGTLVLPQLLYRKTRDAETSLALARYYILAGGTATTSPQMIFQMGCADLIVPQHRRDTVAMVLAQAIIEHGGEIVSSNELNSLNIQRLETCLSFANAREFHIAEDLFAQADLIPTLYAQARGQLPLAYSGEMKSMAERMVRRAAGASPHALWVSNYLISKGFEGFLKGNDNDTLAEFELGHYLRQVFEHPDALIGLEAMVNGNYPEFKRRYPL
jgi:enoyl-CoA hydratase / 3-hydroxyacyl-CoA dehydrogenase